ncbi:MAG TPA: hypothetical protein VHA09_05875 [Nitrososphaera sp.]|nr:hypothetical protein [Nitrososphaera sp.]
MAPFTENNNDNFPSDKLWHAVDKAFDHFGPRLKPVLLDQLKIKNGLSAPEAGATDALTIVKLEKALRSIFKDSTDVIMDWVFDELEDDEE